MGLLIVGWLLSAISFAFGFWIGRKFKYVNDDQY